MEKKTTNSGLKAAKVIITIIMIIWVISPIDLMPFIPLDDIAVFIGTILFDVLAGRNPRTNYYNNHQDYYTNQQDYYNYR